jgi:hypothetical protein
MAHTALPHAPARDGAEREADGPPTPNDAHASLGGWRAGHVAWSAS